MQLLTLTEFLAISPEIARGAGSKLAYLRKESYLLDNLDAYNVERNILF